jgi:hypothetical protein
MHVILAAASVTTKTLALMVWLLPVFICHLFACLKGLYVGIPCYKVEAVVA